MDIASSPLSLTMPMPPSPIGVDIAAIVSSVNISVSSLVGQPVEAIALDLQAEMIHLLAQPL